MLSFEMSGTCATLGLEGIDLTVKYDIWGSDTPATYDSPAEYAEPDDIRITAHTDNGNIEIDQSIFNPSELNGICEAVICDMMERRLEVAQYCLD